MGYLASVNIAEPVSKSVLLFLEGIHQNSVNFDNPLLFSFTVKPNVWGEKRRAKIKLSKKGEKTDH